MGGSTQQTEQHHDGGIEDTEKIRIKKLEYLSRMSEKLGSFLSSSHHHHGHSHSHEHVEYKRPQAMTNRLALFSLRKLAPYQGIILEKDKKVLEPVQPGVISWGLLWGFVGVRVGYTCWTWSLGGFKALYGPRFLATQLGLLVLQKITLFGVDNLRQLAGNKYKEQLARKYRVFFGDEYLLDVLHPQFHLGKFAYPQNYYESGHH